MTSPLSSKTKKKTPQKSSRERAEELHPEQRGGTPLPSSPSRSKAGTRAAGSSGGGARGQPCPGKGTKNPSAAEGKALGTFPGALEAKQ